MEDQENAGQKQELLLFPTRTGKDEMNLIELPFTLLSARNNTNQTMLERHWKSKGEDGRVRKFYKKISGHPKLGLPTFQAEEVYIALMELSNRQGFEDINVYTNRYEMLKLMGWPTTGHYYRQLIDALDQLLAVAITTNAFWDSAKETYVTMGFGIIDGYQFFENEHRRRVGASEQALALPGYVTWNKFLFDSFKRGYIKTLDTKTYFSMSTRTAKRLYRYVDKHLCRGESFEIDLFRLAFEKLEMTSNYRYPSEVIRKLELAIKEHEEKGIAKIRIIRSKTTASGYKVMFSPITKPQVVVPQLDSKKSLPSGDEGARGNEITPFYERFGIVEQLIQRGITTNTARKLAKAYPAKQIQKQMEVFDWLKEKKSPLIGKNPAGFLRRSIEEDYQPPREYLDQQSKKDKEQKERDRYERWLKHREELIRQEVASWDRIPLEKRIEGRLEFWIAGETLNGRTPSPEQIEIKRQELIDSLPKTDEEKWKYIAQNYPEDPPRNFE